MIFVYIYKNLSLKTPFFWLIPWIHDMTRKFRPISITHFLCMLLPFFFASTKTYQILMSHQTMRDWYSCHFSISYRVFYVINDNKNDNITLIPIAHCFGGFFFPSLHLDIEELSIKISNYEISRKKVFGTYLII